MPGLSAVALESNGISCWLIDPHFDLLMHGAVDGNNSPTLHTEVPILEKTMFQICIANQGHVQRGIAGGDCVTDASGGNPVRVVVDGLPVNAPGLNWFSAKAGLSFSLDIVAHDPNVVEAQVQPSVRFEFVFVEPVQQHRAEVEPIMGTSNRESDREDWKRTILDLERILDRAIRYTQGLLAQTDG